MKKIFTFALLAGMCTSLAFASQTRIDSLGIADWMIEEDDSLIWMNPARVGDSTGNVWAEWPAGGPIGTGYNPTALANPWGGISKSLDLFDFAVFVGKRYTGNLGLTGTTDPNFGPSVGLPTDIGGVFSGTSMDSTTPTGKLDFLVGMTKNERQFGARVSLASDSRVNEADVSVGTPVFFAADFEESFKNSDIELAIGMKTADVWKFESLDVVAQLNMMNAKNLATYSEFDLATNRIELVEENVFDFDGKMGLSAMARGVLPFGTGKLVTKAKFASMDVSSKYSEKVDMDSDYKIDNFGTDIDRIQIREHKGSEILVGAAMNTPITERTLMILGLSLSNTKETLNEKKEELLASGNGVDTEYNQESSTLLLPINLGLETSLSEKLSLRAGFAKDLINRRKSVSKEGLFNTTTNPGGPFTKEGQVDEEMIVDNVIGNATITLGIGWDVLENVTIDAVLRQEVLFTGGYLLSGVPETLASQLTATLRY